MRIQAGVKTFRFFFDFSYGDIHWEIAVQILLDLKKASVGCCLEIHDLGIGMDTGFGSGTTIQFYVFIVIFSMTSMILLEMVLVDSPFPRRDQP